MLSHQRSFEQGQFGVLERLCPYGDDLVRRLKVGGSPLKSCSRGETIPFTICRSPPWTGRAGSILHAPNCYRVQNFRSPGWRMLPPVHNGFPELTQGCYLGIPETFPPYNVLSKIVRQPLKWIQKSLRWPKDYRLFYQFLVLHSNHT